MPDKLNSSKFISIEWRCVSRLENTGLFCTASTILEDTLKEKIVEAINVQSAEKNSGFMIVATKIHGSYEEDGFFKVFVTTYFATYKLYDNVLDMMTAGIVPLAITYKKDGNGITCLKSIISGKTGADWNRQSKNSVQCPYQGGNTRACRKNN